MQPVADANRDRIQVLTDAWNDRDRDRMRACFADEFTIHGDDPTTHTGDDQVDAEFAFFDAFPDVTATIGDTISEPDRILVRWTVTGTHDGEFAGIAPTGNEITYEEWAVYDVVAGELAGVRAIRNELDMVVDLGAVDWPPQEPAE